ncbi:hypothetical protein FEM48_Zijuj01G0023700 [Ziziphus jujuba var. spinosa]|uniref:Uncharacterized protein n=1 Tax=Ziziphus jujuba var. spinosa TaxID=714518 RepID=A0A978VYK7_ZIZJJ|nr:hypothetical protein FEM48_Zijuj01G0023700 [Ziziphus jujuba var. spinosa]
MASLTPGVLSKLLNGVADKDFKVTGDHRSALLQVIEILPSLGEGDDDDDPWSSRGFFLKVSDSLHAAYVSISDHDLDLIYSDKIQLGQFVYVTRLDSASPVPVVRGLKPVPRRRPSPCVGNPIDLVSSDLLQIGSRFGFEKAKSNGVKNNVEKGGSKRRDLNNGNGKTKARSSISVSEAIVKSRFGSSATINSNGSSAKKMVNEGLDLRRLSLDSARRAWNHTPTSNDTAQGIASRFKSKQVISDKKASVKHDSSVKRPSLSISSPLKTKNETCSPMLINKTPKVVNSTSEQTIPNRLVKVALSSKTWSEQGISWNKFPPAINDLGKLLCELSKKRQQQRVSYTACELCESPQKVSAGSLVQKFLDLNQSMQSAAMVVDSLLNQGPRDEQHWLTPDVCKTSSSKNATLWVKAAVETNLSKFNLFRLQDKGEVLNGEKCHCVILENASVESKSENCSPKSKQSPRNHGSSSSDSNSKSAPSSSRKFLSTARKPSTEREKCLKGSRLKEAASLAEKLLLLSREWFLKYLEDSLKIGFRVNRGGGGSEMACLLGQLKRVNQWLDNLVMDRIQEDERIEDLRKKLYRFLLEHVDSAVVSGK